MGWMCERCGEVSIGNEWICADPYVQRDHADDPFDAFTRPDVYKRQYEGCYALPGGFVGPKETIGEAAERELKEETNCNCNFLEQFGTYSNPNRDPRRWVISNGYMALVNAEQEIIQAGDDASDAKWFDVSFQEEAGIWNLCLTHGDEKLHARLEETTSKWDVKKKFKTIESDDLADVYKRQDLK